MTLRKRLLLTIASVVGAALTGLLPGEWRILTAYITGILVGINIAE